MPDHTQLQKLKENKDSMIRTFLKSDKPTLVIIQYYTEQLAFNDMILISETIGTETHGRITINEEGKEPYVFESNANIVNMYKGIVDKTIYTFSENSASGQGQCAELSQQGATVYYFGYV